MAADVLAAGNIIDSGLQGFRSRSRGSDLKTLYGDRLDIAVGYENMDPRAPLRLAGDGVQRDAMNMSLSAKLPGGLNGDAQVAYSAFDSQSDRVYREARNRFMRLKFAGAAGLGNVKMGEYGMEYRSVGKGFRRQPGMPTFRLDQEGTETWVQRGFGPLSFKGMYQQYANNVEGDPRRPRTETTLSGSAATLTVPSGLSLTLGYLSGEDETRRPHGKAPQQNTIQQYSAMVSYWRPTWDVSLLSMIMPAQDKLSPDRQTRSTYHEVGFNFRPTESIYISPYLNYSETIDKTTGSRSMNPSAMMSLTWSDIISGVSWNSFFMVERGKSNDGYVDTNSVMMTNSVILALPSRGAKRFLSVDMLYSRYVDSVYQDSSYREWLGRVMFTVLPL